MSSVLVVVRISGGAQTLYVQTTAYVHPYNIAPERCNPSSQSYNIGYSGLWIPTNCYTPMWAS